MRHEHLLVHFLELGGEKKIIKQRCDIHRDHIWSLQQKYKGLDTTSLVGGKEYERDLRKMERHEAAIASMQSHSKYVVQNHARAAHIAYNFLSGNEYHEVERSAKTKPDWLEVKNFVVRFWDRFYFHRGHIEVMEKFNEWLVNAEGYYRTHRLGFHPKSMDRKFAYDFDALEPLVLEKVRMHEILNAPNKKVDNIATPA